MSSDETPLAHLETLWGEHNITLDALSLHDGTIVPPDRSKPELRLSLPLLTERGEHGEHPLLEIGDTLGQGGMGLVRSGRQHALGRSVAVKSLLSTDPEAAHKLLLEARVTGVLEHPNIVPIYTLGQDASGTPLIVMKRIEGTAWSELLNHPEALPEDETDPLDHHLDILMQVARAVHFAHVRGVLHRDLKPENVMIGSFGEVYLLDWGIAVGLEHGDVEGLPPASDVQGLAGTPRYMAPEQAAPTEWPLSEATDVYLLGAILHEIVTGAPPHGGETLSQTLLQAYVAEPPPLEGVPEGLRRVVQRALAREPEQRYPDAEPFRQALQHYRVTRHSEQLTDAALDVMAQLQQAQHGDEALFTQCRLGFVQALQIWPENPRAVAGLQQALEARIGVELERGSPRTARVLVSELPEPAPELQARVEDAEREAQREAERAAALDHRKSDSLRGTLTLGFVLSYAVVLSSFGVVGREWGHTFAHVEFAIFNGLGALISVGAARWLQSRRDLNEAFLRFARQSIVTQALFVAFPLLALRLNIPLVEMLTLSLFLGASLWLTIAVLFDRRVLTLPVILFAAIPVMLTWPAWHWEIFGVFLSVGMYSIARAWIAQSSPQTE